jgi:uncharacterized DUF497 family protein
MYILINWYQMQGPITGFDWDKGNRGKCAKHGVSIDEIEAVLQSPVIVLPTHSATEPRFKIVAKTAAGRHLFLVFVIRDGKIRPISARYMHRKEIQRYEEKAKDTPGL